MCFYAHLLGCVYSKCYYTHVLLSMFKFTHGYALCNWIAVARNVIYEHHVCAKSHCGVINACAYEIIFDWIHAQCYKPMVLVISWIRT